MCYLVAAQRTHAIIMSCLRVFGLLRSSPSIVLSHSPLLSSPLTSTHLNADKEKPGPAPSSPPQSALSIMRREQHITQSEGEEFHFSESVVSGTTATGGASGPDEADSATAPHPPAAAVVAAAATSSGSGGGGVAAASPGRRQRQKERISGQGTPPPPPPAGPSSLHHPAPGTGAPHGNRAPLIHSSSAASVVTTNSAVLGALGVLDRSSSRQKLQNKVG